MLGVQRRACQLVLADGPLVLLSPPDVPLGPNALAIDVERDLTLRDVGLQVGHVVALGSSVTPTDRRADWLVTLDVAATWEPRPRVHRLAPRDLAGRVGTARARVIAEGAAASLLPVLWAPEGGAFQAGLADVARPPARRLCEAAVRGGALSLTRAARGLAGLGPGLTPSGDDLLAGFAAAWILAGESLGLEGAAHRRVTDAILDGAERGASTLGRAWLEHACRGELPEPMTAFVGTLLAPRAGDLDAAVRGALAVGSSSGTDWMVGFLLGAEALAAATRRRSW